MGAQVYNQTVERLYCPSTPSKKPRRESPAWDVLNRTKRTLFGKGEPEESKKFSERELRKHIAESSKKWNFDFEKERPMQGGRFNWEPMSRKPVITLTRAAHTLQRSSSYPEGENSDKLVLSDDLMDERADRANRTDDLEPFDDSIRCATSPSSSLSLNSSRLKQQKITAFMKERKRLQGSTSSVKLSAEKVRLALGDRPLASDDAVQPSN